MDHRVPEHRDSHASSSHEASLEPTLKVPTLCQNSLPEKPKLHDLSEDTLQGPKRPGTVMPKEDNLVIDICGSQSSQ